MKLYESLTLILSIILSGFTAFFGIMMIGLPGYSDTAELLYTLFASFTWVMSCFGIVVKYEVKRRHD